MIIVTGTKRSGTSMWMQILRDAGLQVVGEPFSKDWEQTIRDANPHGFYESPLRRGIYHATNPEPGTGRYLRAEDTTHTAVKVFVPGVVRTERAYLHRVIASVRNWREYGESLDRLTSMETENRQRLGKQKGPPLPRLTPWLEWWRENHMLMRDVAIRQYPVTLVAYDTVLRQPERTLTTIFRWLGRGDVAGGMRSVKPETRNYQDVPPPPDVPAAMVQVFDEYCARVLKGQAIDGPFIETLNRVNAELEPRVEQEARTIRMAAARRRYEAARERARASGVAAPDIVAAARRFAGPEEADGSVEGYAPPDASEGTAAHDAALRDWEARDEEPALDESGHSVDTDDLDP
jgi:hypothetical protein